MHQVKEKGNLAASQDKQESPFPMTTIPELSESLQTLLSTTADTLEKKQALSNDSGK
jgi:hypothetical protein